MAVLHHANGDSTHVRDDGWITAGLHARDLLRRASALSAAPDGEKPGERACRLHSLACARADAREWLRWLRGRAEEELKKLDLTREDEDD